MENLQKKLQGLTQNNSTDLTKCILLCFAFNNTNVVCCVAVLISAGRI